jgi:hypothetical protein
MPKVNNSTASSDTPTVLFTKLARKLFALYKQLSCLSHNEKRQNLNMTSGRDVITKTALSANGF